MQSATPLPSNPIPDPPAADQPGLVARWILAGVAFTAYLPLQIIIALPFVLGAIVLGLISVEQLMVDPGHSVLLWISIIAAALAGVFTVAVMFAWPALWGQVSSVKASAGDWFAWRKPRIIPLWVIPFLTLPFLVLAGLLVSSSFGPSNVELQEQLFQVPVLREIALVIVSTLVPFAEEVVFRGAIYSALLETMRRRITGWQAHILPVIVSAASFAFVHLFAGFEAAGSIMLVLLLSIYLTTLRAVTGSVRSSIVGHLVWNLVAALGLLASTQLNM